MEWVKVAVSHARDPKMVGADPLVRLLYIDALCYCGEHETDGRMTPSALALVCTYTSDPRPLADELVARKLWRRRGRGWTFPPEAWARWQPTRAEIAVTRARNRERVAAYRTRKAAEKQAAGNGVTGGGVTHNVTRYEEGVTQQRRGEERRDMTTTPTKSQQTPRQAAEKSDISETVQSLAARFTPPEVDP